MLVGCCVLSVVCCVLFDVRCLMVVACVVAVWCVVLVGCCLLCVVCCVVVRLSFVVCGLLL